jgi:1-acyl-sn-glycerol-3-phosphate acyltransferase
MWINYQKPRPMKEGAFSFATKYSVPVVPIFCTFQKDRHGHMKKLRINILPPIYPDETLKKNERTAAMLEAAQAEWQACYEKAYGIPLTYLDRKPNEKKGS